MAMMTTNVASFAGLNAAVANWFADTRKAATQRAAYRQTVNELSRLSEQELEDLGLNYADIRDAAYHAVYASK